MKSCYLGGAIRRGPDGKVHQRDVAWRINAANLLSKYGINVFDPLIENSEVVAAWEQEGFTWNDDVAQKIYKSDLRGMHESRVGVFDLTSLEEGYPCQGSIFEIGYMTAHLKHVIIASDDEKLRCNPMFADCVFVSQPGHFISRVVDIFQNKIGRKS